MADVVENGFAKKSAAAKIVAEKVKSNTIRERYETSKALKKQR